MSYVKIEEHICDICGTKHETGALLLDKRLKDIPEGVSGISTCSDCESLHQEGYIALIGVDPDKSTISRSNTLNNRDAYRTGDILHIKQVVAEKLFDKDVKEKFVFVEPEVITQLTEMMPKH